MEASEAHEEGPSRGSVLIVEDDQLMARALETTLLEFGFAPCTTTCSADEALRLAHDSAPDVVLMDICLEGDSDGVEAARRLREQLGLRVVYLTASSDPSTVERAKVTQPYGYLLKPIRPLDLRCCLELAVHQGRLEQDARAHGASSAPREQNATLNRLSEREIEVLTLIARGHTSRDIAEALQLAKPTVDTYRSRLTEKLGARSRKDLVSIASRAGLLDPRALETRRPVTRSSG